MAKKKKRKHKEPKLTQEQIRKILEQTRESMRRARFGPERQPIEDIVKGECGICRGPVVERVQFGYFGPPELLILGPGSRNQMTTKHMGFHCSSCGVKYEFPPPMKQKKTKRNKRDPYHDEWKRKSDPDIGYTG